MLRKVSVAVILLSALVVLAKKPTPRKPHAYFPASPQALTRITKEGIHLGRLLFYDPLLSADSTISCSHCHQQNFAFSDSNKQFSSGIRGEKLTRNTPALFNLAWFPSYFLDGRVSSLNELIRFPIHDSKEMNSNWILILKRLNAEEFYRKQFKKKYGSIPIDSNMVSDCLSQFLLSLLSSHSKYDSVILGLAHFDSTELAGFRLFNDQTKGGCLHCHTTDGSVMGTNFQFSNNGLDSVDATENYLDPGQGGFTKQGKDYGKFMVPTVRNLGFTAPYMHDGRFKTLNEVLDFYAEHVYASVNVDSKMEFAHSGGNHLSQQEKNSIIAFLRTMDDYHFVHDKEFSSPFVAKRK